jgi:hypothetical protein
MSCGGPTSLALIRMAKTNSTDDARLAVPTPEGVKRLNAFWQAFVDDPLPRNISPRDRMDAWAIEQQIIADKHANDRMTKATWGPCACHERTVLCDYRPGGCRTGPPLSELRCDATSRNLLAMRDLDTIDSELRPLAAVRWSIREHGGEPSSRQVDELLDERLAHLRGT